MGATRAMPRTSLQRHYSEALSAYLMRPGEAARMRAYEIGRDALAAGQSIPDVVGVHSLALQELLAATDTRAGMQAVIATAGAFLTEALSPFEMTHRGYRDSLTAWRHINETLEAEIKRIAYALHDESGQLLVSVHLQLAQLARAVPAAESGVRACQTLLDQAERQLRDLSHELRPMVLDDLGWLPAIEFLATAVAARARVPVDVRSSVTRRLPAAVEIALYRVVQEALTNAARHARASRILVEIGAEHGSLQCVIGDDGVGFAVDAAALQGLGLKSMRERLGALGGALQVVSAPGCGAQIRFEVPLD